MSETTPSENEWLVMEIIWSSESPITATEIIDRLRGTLDVTAKTVRAMLNRLLSKGIIGYNVDKQDSRVYHYYAVKTKKNCLDEKRRRYIKNYFGGNVSLAVTNFIQEENITEGELEELARLVDNLRKK